VIVLPDADIELATSAVAAGGFINAGQVWISVQVVFVNNGVGGKFGDGLEQQAGRAGLETTWVMLVAHHPSWPDAGYLSFFDLRWAATVTEHALRRLREECEAKGRLRVFDALSSCLGAERTDVSYSNIAAALGIQETAVKKLLHRLRQRYRELLRGEVADTVADPAEIVDEIRYLCAALAAGGA
jgi:hypothetical protein